MKKMLLASCLILFFSCEKAMDYSIHKSSENLSISLDEALENLNTAINTLYGSGTKAMGTFSYSHSNIQTFTSDKLMCQTKGGFNVMSIPDSLFYIVNFDDDQGFAILSATKRLSSDVYCITESGHLSIEDFNINFHSSQTKSSDSDSSEEEFVPIGLDVIPALLISDIMIELSTEQSQSDNNDSITKAGTLKYGPYLKTKWEQKYSNYGQGVRVFNRYTPHHAPAGCVAIATAQIMESKKYASGNNYFDGVHCDWNNMETVNNYMDIGTYLSGDTTYFDQVAHFVREVGRQCDINYGNNEFGSSSGGYAVGAKQCLEHYGYSNVKRLLGFGSTNQNKASLCIRNENPVYLDGYKTGLGGHAWVLDGEFGNFYHINWGYAGASDGYYEKGVFKTTSRYTRDLEYDRNTSEYDLEFTWDFRLVTYEL
ncbi:MAG: C10 family peptidase [Bacteroidales bacterium]|nr:C10 family peptidase [Bacteroidales bacterium]